MSAWPFVGVVPETAPTELHLSDCAITAVGFKAIMVAWWRWLSLCGWFSHYIKLAILPEGIPLAFDQNGSKHISQPIGPISYEGGWRSKKEPTICLWSTGWLLTHDKSCCFRLIWLIAFRRAKMEFRKVSHVDICGGWYLPSWGANTPYYLQNH